MHQTLINRLVAIATGETCATIDQLGFSIADPLDHRFDPEPPVSDQNEPEKYLDWDEVDAQRFACQLSC